MLAEGYLLYVEEITALLLEEGRLVLEGGRWIGDRRPLRSPGPSDHLRSARRTDRQTPVG